MEVYIFNHEALNGRDGDTLYKLKLPSLPVSELQPPEPEPEPEELLSPVLEFPKDKYPRSMGCVQFDSKLYFFGGIVGSPVERMDYESLRTAEEVVDLTRQKYPADVYVFDTRNNDNCGDHDVVLNRVASMTTGKPDPFGFVANGMIYVIGGSVSMPFKYDDTSIKRFERFNPADQTWQVLDDAPLRQITSCTGATVVESQHKVLISVWQGLDLLRIVYDFLHDRWDSECLNVSPFLYPDFFVYACSDYNGGPQFLYGYRFALPYPVPMKLGPLPALKDLDQFHKLPIIDMSAVVTGKAGAFSRPFLISRRAKYRMSRTADGHLCYVVTGQVCPMDPPYGFRCPHTRKLSVIIAKEKDKELEQEPKAGHGGFSFDAEILCVKDYIINANYHGDFDVGGCFIFSTSHCKCP